MTEAVDVEVTAVMPCLNEERTLPLCIDKIRRAFAEAGLRGEIVVADNGSTDGSVRVAEALGARVVHEPRKGYGAALSAGITAAEGRVVVMADADDSYDWLALADFVRAVDAGADLVMGNRFLGGIAPGAMPALHRYLGNPVLSFLTRRMYRIPIGDFHCGMRAFTREAFARMGVRSPGMEFATEMVVNAAHAGLRITEIPTRLFPDKRDRPPHLRSFRDGWRHLRFMLTYAPDWLYLIPGGVLFVAGFFGMAALAGGPITLAGYHFGIHFLALASLLSLLGANVTSFGLFARLVHLPRNPLSPGSLFSRFVEGFTLERGLLVGAGLAAIGLGIDGWILAQWLERRFGDMSETVHLVFVASTLFMLGINLMFGAFLFNMIREQQR